MNEILNRRQKISSNIVLDIAVILYNKLKKIAKLVYLFDNDTSTVLRYYFSFGKCNIAAHKRYKQRMETVEQTRNAVMLQIELSVLLIFTIHKKNCMD